MKRLLILVAVLLCPLTTYASAEEPSAFEPHIGGYVGVFGGYRFSGSFTDVEWRMSTISGTGDNLKYDGDFLGGIKLGAWFNRFVGAQIEGWYSRVKIPTQSWTVHFLGVSVTDQFDGGDLDTYTGAFNLMARFPLAIIEPYVGVGVAFLHMPTTEFDDPTPGLNVLAGLQIHLSKHVAAFGEFKYSRFDLEGRENNFELKMRYEPMAVVGGLSFQFGGQ